MLLDARVEMKGPEVPMPLLDMAGHEGPMQLLDMRGPDGPLSLIRSQENRQMSHLCRVCGQRAAGFHFGVFTCEGCKSFFGRTYNNLSAVYGCKNGGNCIINMETRTSCKACRLKKCLMVGMSKNGSRYGRRSNWFKIHCMLEEQSNQTSQHENEDTLPFNKSDIFKSNLEEMYNSSNFNLPFPSSSFKPQRNIFDVDSELKSMQMKMMNKPPATTQDTNLNQVANTFNFMNQINNPMFSPHLGFSPLYISQLLKKTVSQTNPSELHSSPPISPSTTSVAPLTPPLEVDDFHSTHQSSPGPVISPLLPLQLQEELMQSLHMQRLFWNRKRNSDSFHEETHQGIANHDVQVSNQTREQDSPIDLSVKRPRYNAWSTTETAFPDSPPSTPLHTTPALVDTPIDLSIRT